MAILSGIPVLNCQSIESTLDFYQQLLQFVIVKKRDVDGHLHWVHLMHGDTTIMLQRFETPQAEIKPSRHSSITLYFFVDNLNELHHFIKAKCASVSEIKVTAYRLQEFSLTDPEGNTVIVGMAPESR